MASSRIGARPARPSQLDPMMLEQLPGGVSPEALSDMSHASAAALLDKVRHSSDPLVVRRVLTLVEREGVDVVARLWSEAEPESLPGALWRLYMLRLWMRQHSTAMARLWRLGEPLLGAASAVAGVGEAPDAHEVARAADSILSGAFVGDFAVALERAATFTQVIADGMVAYVRRRVQLHEPMSPRARARLLHHSANLRTTSHVFAHAAQLWRLGKLE